MRPKLIISDIDGTMLPEGCGPESPAVRGGIAELRELIAREKLQFTLASGRPVGMMRPLWEALGLRLPVVACNGAAACVPDGSSGFLWNERLDPLCMRPAMELADALGMAVIVSDADGGGNEHVYRENDYTRRHAAEGKKWNRVYRPESEADWKGYSLQKLLIIDPVSPGKVDAVIEKLRETEREFPAARPCEVVRYDDRGVEIMPESCTKESGVRRLCAMLSVPLSEVLVCGDNKNDLGMFREAGMSAAVGNAAEAAKETAGYVCRAEAVFGVLEAVRHFCGC